MRRTLQLLDDVVVQVEICFEMSELISRSLRSRIFNNCQCLAHLSNRQKFISRDSETMMILRIRIFVEEREDICWKITRGYCAPPRVYVLWSVPESSLHDHALVV